jgi:DeoR/GlpR family transcriptional regulator of sugar metabolism
MLLKFGKVKEVSKLLLEERHQIIRETLLKHGKVTVSGLAKKFNISMETVRRDLDYLEKAGELKRTHGGAVKFLYHDNLEPYFDLKMTAYKEEKDRIAKAACNEIQDGDTIALDTGTTTAHMCKYLTAKKNLTIIVNNFYILEQLINYCNNGLLKCNLFSVGGEVNTSQRSCIGTLAEQYLNDIYVDKAFISPTGFSLENGFSSLNTYEAAISKKLISIAKETFMLLDRSKIGVNNFYRINHISSDISIISDIDVPHEWEKELKIIGCSWIKA